MLDDLLRMKKSLTKRPEKDVNKKALRTFSSKLGDVEWYLFASHVRLQIGRMGLGLSKCCNPLLSPLNSQNARLSPSALNLPVLPVEAACDLVLNEPGEEDEI